MTRAFAGLVVLGVVAFGATATAQTTTTTGSTSTTTSSGTTGIIRADLGSTAPANAPGQELYLQRVTIAPGAKLPEHFHQGTQIARILGGVLTYDIASGSAVVTRADGKTETVDAPATVTLEKGDGLVETQGLVHHGSNRGKKPVVIEIASLLAAGAPLSTPVAGRARPGPRSSCRLTSSRSRARSTPWAPTGRSRTAGTSSWAPPPSTTKRWASSCSAT